MTTLRRIKAVSPSAWGCLILGVVTLSGCATIYEGKYAFEDGWREAVIQKIGSASEIATPQFSDCRENMTQQQLGVSQFALVSYRRMGRLQRSAVPLRKSVSPIAGQVVYVNVTDCDARLVSRI